MDLHRLALEPMAGARHGQHLCLPAKRVKPQQHGGGHADDLCWPLRAGSQRWRSNPRGGAQQDQHRRSALRHGHRLPIWMRLFWKASMSTFPLSTTWVFLGLLAGREIAIRWRLHLIDRQPLNAVLGRDVFKAGIGIVVSLAVAFAIQPLKAMG